MMKLPIKTLAVAATVAGLAACSSSSSSTVSGHVTSHPASTRPATVSGTERFHGTVSGEAVMASNPPTYPLTFTGPVATTGTFTPPNTTATHQVGVFQTKDGNMAVVAVVSGQNAQPKLAGPDCLYRLTIKASYVVNGAKSTGRFAGAVGHGTVVSPVEFHAPKLANGTCNTSQTAKPTGAVSTFTGSGPLTVKQQ
jgi:hypothetical protein